MVTGECLAESAEVLPQGVFRTDLKYTHFFDIDERYNESGDTEDAATDFNANLNSEVFPVLQLVESNFSMPSGSASIGDTLVSFDYSLNGLELDLYYGLTNKLTVGIKVPYWWKKNKVSAAIDSGAGSSATVGTNRDFGNPASPLGAAPLIPLALGGVPFTDEDVQNLLTDGLVVNGVTLPGGFGYDRFETWSKDDIGDIEAGARYQYFKSDDWRLAFTGGIIFPTGDINDPDNLVDLSYGSGAYGLIFAFNNDYTKIDNWIFNATLRYDWMLTDDDVTQRVPESSNEPITARTEVVDRDVGDLFWVDLQAAYTPDGTSSYAINYKYTTKQKDDISGSSNLSYKGLEDETDSEQHLIILGYTYSNLAKYMRTKQGIPFKVGINYRNRFDGKNNALKSQYIQTAFTVFF